MKTYLASLIFCLAMAIVTAVRDVPGTRHMIITFAVLAFALMFGGLVGIIAKVICSGTIHSNREGCRMFGSTIGAEIYQAGGGWKTREEERLLETRSGGERPFQ